MSAQPSVLFDTKPSPTAVVTAGAGFFPGDPLVVGQIRYAYGAQDLLVVVVAVDAETVWYETVSCPPASILRAEREAFQIAFPRLVERLINAADFPPPGRAMRTNGCGMLENDPFRVGQARSNFPGIRKVEVVAITETNVWIWHNHGGLVVGSRTYIEQTYPIVISQRHS